MADDRAGVSGARRSAGGATRAADRADQLIELDVGRVAHGGSCVARADGRVVFVRYALPGERVRAQVTDTSHDRYWRADAVEILVPSPDRVAPPCPHAGPRRSAGETGPVDENGPAGQPVLGGCGGCDWQHASLAAQRRLKAQVVAEALRRQGGLAAHAVDGPEQDRAGVDGTSLAIAVESPPGPGGEDGLGWRTRMRFAVTPAGEVGLRASRSHEVLATPDCRIAHPLVVDAVAGRGFAGAESVEVAASVSSGRVLARAAGRGSTTNPRLTADPRATEPGTATDQAAGQELVERVRGRDFQVDAAAFWQVHPAAASTLVDAVLAALRPRPGERALDLYSGAGLFAAFLAEAVGPDGQVIALESDAAAVASAARSMADLPWVSVRPVRVTAKTVQGAVGLAGRTGPGGLAGRTGPGGLAGRTGPGGPAERAIDVAVLDPPRAGAGTDVLRALLALRPRAVAYVACDPVALGRDLAVAAAGGYRVSDVRAFDLFPMTAHIECVARLVPVS